LRIIFSWAPRQRVFFNKNELLVRQLRNNNSRISIGREVEGVLEMRPVLARKVQGSAAVPIIQPYRFALAACQTSRLLKGISESNNNGGSHRSHWSSLIVQIIDVVTKLINCLSDVRS